MRDKGFAWWQKGVVYQVYPRSYQDTDNDGIGDLEGIRRRLDHLVDLGVDALWLSPIYPSPMADFGYDVADYCGVHPMFGVMADFDRLLADAHAKGLKLILDFVPNHSSNQHPWFLQSRSSRDNPKRDWYIWRDPAPDGGPPNNWLANFGGNAWTFDAATGQYYHHAFLPEQPDLNWRNPEVQAAMHDVLRFWLAKGVDGFRVDVIWHIVKDEQFRDNPSNPDWHEGIRTYNRHLPLYTTDRPEVFGLIKAMRRVVDEFEARVLIGEIYLPLERLVAYYGPDMRGVHMPFNFHLLLTDWDAAAVGRLIRDYEALLPEGAWPNWVLGNHDNHRVANRIGRGQARVAAMLLLTLRGTPTLYYGEEIGMEDVAIPLDRIQDPAEIGNPGIGVGRDPERTPMLWDDGPFAGFSDVEPWLPVGDARGSVAVQAQDPHSMLSLHRTLLERRRGASALSVGGIALLDAAPPLLAYRREGGGETYLVVLNFKDQPAVFDLPEGGWEAVVSTHLDRIGVVQGVLDLRADEGVLLRGRG